MRPFWKGYTVIYISHIVYITLVINRFKAFQFLCSLVLFAIHSIHWCHHMKSQHAANSLHLKSLLSNSAPAPNSRCSWYQLPDGYGIHNDSKKADINEEIFEKDLLPVIWCCAAVLIAQITVEISRLRGASRSSPWAFNWPMINL